MKKLLVLAILLVLAGCLNTENRRVVVRRGDDGVSVIDTRTQPWWRTPVTADTPRDQNPWEAFVRPNPLDQRWYDPWGNDPLSNYGVPSLSEQLQRLGPPPAKLTPKESADERHLFRDQPYLEGEVY